MVTRMNRKGKAVRLDSSLLLSEEEQEQESEKEGELKNENSLPAKWFPGMMAKTMEEAKADAPSPEELLAVLYDELRRLAAQKMAAEAPGHTLQATALVHEAWLRLGADSRP